MFLRCSIGVKNIPIHLETKVKFSFPTFCGTFQLCEEHTKRRRRHAGDSRSQSVVFTFLGAFDTAC